jgi:hypothetical protein
MNPLKRDKIKLEETLERAKKGGDSEMVAWCEKWLKRAKKGGDSEMVAWCEKWLKYYQRVK